MSCRTLRTALLLTITVGGVAPPHLHAQDIGSDPRVRDAISLLDRWVDAQQAYQQFPGISIGVVHDQSMLWAKGFGIADPADGGPATASTIYSICSISKLFTSVAAMRLVDQGLVSLDAPIVQALPWFSVDADEAESQRITLRTLLTHTSGLKEDIGVPSGSKPYLHRASDDEFRSLLPQEKLLHPPGGGFTYSNLGIALIGAMIEEVSGESFEDFVAHEILDPLAMSSTTVDIGDVWGSPRVAAGHGSVGRDGIRRRVEPFEANAVTPAMGFASTVEDLARFISWQFRLLDGETEILDASTLRDMYRAHFADSASATFQGLGFALYRYGPMELVGHSGFCPGFRSDLAIDPERRLGIVALSNSMIPAWEFTVRAHEIVGPAIDAALADSSGVRHTPDEFMRYVGTYEGFPYSGEWQVVPWKGSLAVLHLPVDDPLEVLRPLGHIGDAVFRVQKPDGTLGMWVRFEADSSGEVTRMFTDDYPRSRIR